MDIKRCVWGNIPVQRREEESVQTKGKKGDMKREPLTRRVVLVVLVVVWL